MINPFTVPGWNMNRYMLSSAVAAVATVFAISLPAAMMAGLSGPAGMAIGGYSVLGLSAIVELCRLGASNLKNLSARRACLSVLEIILWGLVILSVPISAFNIVAFLNVGPTPDSERHVFGIISMVFGILAVIAGMNLALLLRSSLWASFRAFVREERNIGQP